MALIFTGCKKQAQAVEDTTQNSLAAVGKVSTPATTDTTTHNAASPTSYSYQWKKDGSMPPVCIVIDDFGANSGKLLEGFAQLDNEITFAVLPDLPYSVQAAKTANIYGHEVIIHLPMEALDSKQNPGKRFIKAGDTPEQITQLLNDWMQQLPQAIGANNHMGSRATSDYEDMKTVLSVLHKHGLFFLDSRTNPQSKVYNAAQDLHVDYASRDMFLDVPDVSAANITAKLKELEKYKGRREPVIIISHCHNQAKLDAMRSFLSQLKGMGVELIPLSDAINRFKVTS